MTPSDRRKIKPPVKRRYWTRSGKRGKTSCLWLCAHIYDIKTAFRPSPKRGKNNVETTRGFEHISVRHTCGSPIKSTVFLLWHRSKAISQTLSLSPTAPRNFFKVPRVLGFSLGIPKRKKVTFLPVNSEFWGRWKWAKNNVDMWPRASAGVTLNSASPPLSARAPRRSWHVEQKRRSRTQVFTIFVHHLLSTSVLS